MKYKLRILIPFLLLLCSSLFVLLNKDNRRTTVSNESNALIDDSRYTLNESNTNSVISNNTTPFTGEELTSENKSNLPFMAIIENSKVSRPQSGLSEADIVYETMAEGGIPRFIALFQSKSPKEIGPIRSARPYFISISKEYNLPFAHCGGSAEALDKIKNEKLMSMNEYFYGKYYWRDFEKKAPHNLYTSAEKLRNLISFYGFNKKASSALTFDNSFWENKSFLLASNIYLVLNSSYKTSYTYKNGFYFKSMDNVAAIDISNENPIAIKNIIIQITNIETRTDERINIQQIGKGIGYVISNGKYIKINWSKETETSPTILKDEKGQRVKLSIGNSWWHITDKKCIFEFK